MRNIIYIILGSVSLGLGIIGIVLPILPTTPFILLAAYFYLRGSERLYFWLINHKVFGKYVYNYLTHKAIPLRAKISAIVLIWITIPICWILLKNLVFRIIITFIAIIVSIYIFILKTLKKETPKRCD
ncbi:MAG: YbaN family protein [Bacilli bacterium]